MNVEIPQSDLAGWKRDPVTKAIFEYLKSIKEHYLELLTSEDLISNPNGHLRLNNLRGYVSAIEDLLNLHSTLSESDFGEDDETGESTR